MTVKNLCYKYCEEKHNSIIFSLTGLIESEIFEVKNLTQNQFEEDFLGNYKKTE